MLFNGKVYGTELVAYESLTLKSNIDYLGRLFSSVSVSVLVASKPSSCSWYNSFPR